MTKRPMADLHARIPAETMERADAMATEDAGPHKPDRGRWLTDLIEAEWKRRQRKAEKPGMKAPVKRRAGQVRAK